MIAKKDFGGFRARLLNGASVAAVLAVGITVGMGGASPARAVDKLLGGNADAATAVLDDENVVTNADDRYGSMDIDHGGADDGAVGKLTINHDSTMYVFDLNGVGATGKWEEELAIRLDKTLHVVFAANGGGAASFGGKLVIDGLVTAPDGSLNMKVRTGTGVNGVSIVQFTKAISLRELTVAAGAGAAAAGSLLTIENVAMASKVKIVTFSGGKGAAGIAAGIGGALVISQHAGAWTGEKLTISGGVGGVGGVGVGGAGGAVTITAFAGAVTAEGAEGSVEIKGGAGGDGSDSTANAGGGGGVVTITGFAGAMKAARVLIAGGAGGAGGDGSADAVGGIGGGGGAIADRSVVSSVITGNVEIAGGAGGAGGKALLVRAGGMGGIGGAVVGITMSGLITGDLTIASGDAGDGGEASGGALGGAGAAGGLVAITGVMAGVAGNVIVTSGAGSNGGKGGIGFAGGASAAGGAVTVTTIHHITGDLTVTSGAGGIGAKATTAAGAAGGAGGLITLAELASDAGGIGGDVSITTGGGGDAGDGVLNLAGGKGGAGGAVAVTLVTGNIVGSVTLTTGDGGVGGLAVGGNGLAGGVGGSITVGEISDIGRGLTATAGSGGDGGAVSGNANGGDGGDGGDIDIEQTATNIAGNVALRAGSGGAGGDLTGNGAGEGGGGASGGGIGVTLTGDITGNVELKAGSGGISGAVTDSGAGEGGAGGNGGGVGLVLTGGITGKVELRAGSGGNSGGFEGGGGGHVKLTVSGDIVGDVLLDDGEVGEAYGDDGAGGAGGKAVLRLDGGATQKVTGAITAYGADEGKIVIMGDAGGEGLVTFKGQIGTESNRIGTIASGLLAKLANSKFESDVYAKAIVHGVNSNWDTDNPVTMDFDGDVTFDTLVVRAGASHANEDAKVRAAKNLMGTTITLTEGTLGQAYLILDGTAPQTVSAEIRSSAGGNGFLQVDNSVTFEKNIGTASNNRLASIIVAAGKTMTLSGARTVGATIFNIAGAAAVKDGAALSLAGTLTLGDRTVLDLAAAGKATLKLGSFAVDEATVINAKAANAMVNLSGDSVTVVIPATFTEGTLTLIDFGAADGSANNDASKFKVSDSFLASYAITAEADSDVTLTATPVEVADMATDWGTTVDAANAVKSASVALSRAANEDTAARTAFDAVFMKVPTDATPAEKKVAKTTAEQLQPSPSTAGAIVSLVTSTGAVSLGVSSSRLASLRSGSAFALTAAASGFAAGEGAAAKSVWLKPFANMATQDAKSGIAGFTTKTGGIAFGADITTSKNVTLGAAVSYAASNIDGKDVSKTDTDIKSYQLTVYGGYTADKWYVEAMAAYAKNKIDTTRKIAFGGLEERKAKGKYDADQYMLRVGGGMPIAVGTDAFVTPTLGFQWSRVSGKTYTETGAGSLNLKVKPGDVDTRLATAGVRFHKSFKKAKWTVVPEVRAGLMYDFSDDGAVSTSTFTGGGASFKTKAAKTEKFGGVVGAGLTFMTKKNVSLSANYDLNFKKGFIGHSGILQLRLNF